MEDAEKKPSTGRKIFIAAVLLLILVVLPAVSWFYLRGGLNWRKTAVAELANYGKIRSVNVIWPDQTKEDMLKSKVVVVHSFGDSPDLTATNRQIIDTGEKLFQQFGQNSFFRLAMIASNGSGEFRTHYQTLPSAEYATWVWTPGVEPWKPVLENAYESFCLAEKTGPAKEYFALADTSGTIRRFYDALDEKQVERMVQHIAILLPPTE